jgi:integrase
MPKLNNRSPKYSNINGRAVVYQNGKPVYLGGAYGSPESKAAYHRFIAGLLEAKESPVPIPHSEAKASPAFAPPSKETLTTVRGLTAEYLDYAKVNADCTTYSFNRVVVLDFLAPLCGNGTPVDSFKPSLLKKVREEIVKSRRFCRRTANRCVNSIISIFRWGVENDLVQETTWRALKAVRPLQKGDLGTFEHEERQPVPDDVVRRTLPFMPPTLQAMVQLQRILGMRPNEIFNMRVGDNVILGVSTHGDERWKDEHGTTLKEIRLRKSESLS